jgi:hypothetical protein
MCHSCIAEEPIANRCCSTGGVPVGAADIALLSVVVLMGWGLYNVLGGEPLWKPDR